MVPLTGVFLNIFLSKYFNGTQEQNVLAIQTLTNTCNEIEDATPRFRNVSLQIANNPITVYLLTSITSKSSYLMKNWY